MNPNAMSKVIKKTITLTQKPKKGTITFTKRPDYKPKPGAKYA